MKRPHFHFTPRKNWINDPNGMVYIDGEYHLFYQHYPEDIVWGPMHWGHAVSTDLLRWEHKEIALYPDEMGYIFSGSCIYDRENVSGLGTSENPPLIAFFTHHDPDNGRQQQSIAYSLDKEHFIKYADNPVIPNTKKRDFRDPKVFENPFKGGYTMAVAAGKVIEFYHSDNLLEWEFTGSFEPGEDNNGYSGICECPDCFPMETGEGTKWVLLISMCLSEEEVKKAMEAKKCASAHVMQYYIGEFDGDTFVDTVCSKEPLLFEYGTDNYAAVTFAQCPERIMLGWGENWNYVKETPAVVCRNENDEWTGEYRGKMTLARKLALVNTRFGYRLQGKPVGIELCKLSDGMNQNDLHTEIVPTTKLNLPKQAFRLHADYEKECKIIFTNDQGKEFMIHVQPEKITIDRSSCGTYAVMLGKMNGEKLNSNSIIKTNSVSKAEKMKEMHYDILYSPRFKPHKSSMEIIYDEGYFEIFADNGLAVFSVMTYPEHAFTECVYESM